jgi:HK97 family phage major capsid protein
MAHSQDFDITAALAEIHGNLLNKTAQHSEKLLEIERRMGENAHTPRPDGTGGNRELRAAADKLMKSEAVLAVLKGHSRQAGFDIPASALRLQTKSAIVSDSGTGTYLAPGQDVGIVGSTPLLVERLRDLIPVSPATSGTVEWLKQTNAKQLAAPQYSADSPALRDGALKKESDFVLVPTVTPVITMAHHVQASRQVLSDNALLLDFLRAELFDGVERKLESQIIDGTGSLGELDGLGNASNFTALSTAQTGDTATDLIRRAIGQLQAAGYAPDAIVLNASDWATIELSKSLQNEYVSGDPRMAMAPTLWGVRVFPSQYIDSGDYIVGAFAQTMRLWVRQDASLLVSESHDDTFLRNVITLLSEARMALTITRGAGVIRSTF